MAKKRIALIGTEAKAAAFAGVAYVAGAVKLTMGPYGRNFASGVRGGPIVTSNDGVSLAKEMVGTAPTEFQEIGLRAVVEAATKTNDAAGDGTTGAVVLTEAILEATGFDKDAVGGKSAVQIAEQIRVESEFVVEKLNAMKIDIEDRDHLIAVAKVSVENDALATLIGGTQFDLTADGVMVVEEHNKPTDEVEFVNGIRWDNGFSSSRFITNPEKQSLELQKVHVLVTNKVFNTAKELSTLQNLWTKLIEQGSTALVIIGRAFDETAINLCVKNLQSIAEGKGSYGLWPINAPYTDQDNIMEDIAAVLGGKYITNDRNMETLSVGDVGYATNLTVRRFEGSVTGLAKGEDPRIDELVTARIVEIEEKLKGEISPFEKRGLLARKAQLTTGTAIIKIGAETEQERRYKKDKAEDAINAVKAAIQEGVVPGGGMALMNVADSMPEGSLITEALRAPYKQIMINAGRTLEISDTIQDPLRVIRTAFQKASSIARSLSTTEILVTWQEEKPKFVQEVSNFQQEEE